MTGGWAATNTLREELTYWGERAVESNGTASGRARIRGQFDAALAALLLVEAALDAAEEFVNPTDYRPGAAYRREQDLRETLAALDKADGR